MYTMDSDEDIIDDEDEDYDDTPADDEDNFAIEMENDLNDSSHNNADDEFEYRILSPEDILLLMVDDIRSVNTIVDIPPTTTRILLHHFKWDKEKLMERYFDGDQDKLFHEAHVVSPFKKCKSSVKKKKSKSDYYVDCNEFSNNLTCEICFRPQVVENMTGIECGHRFCSICWTEYLKTKILDQGMGQTLSCAAHGCDIYVDDLTVMKLITDPFVKSKYNHLITNSFVECNRLLRWCPAADCGYAAKANSFDSKPNKPVTCVCGNSFCFSCGHNWHDPVQCKWLNRWVKKCDDDSETSNWIAANTKECPKCKAIIEKDGGCNHMVCKKCRFDFCWICLGSWEPHGSAWYNCNRFDEEDAKKARNAQEGSRAALTRYLHYYNRYMNHMQSLKFEHKLYAMAKSKMEEMQRHNMSWIEVQFLKKAVDVLCQCRQTLMYTYVFAYYLSKNNQSIIFEDNQHNLESATEQLSEYLERDITADSLVDIKQKVQDKLRFCENRRIVLLNHVHEGYEKEFWDYQERL